MTLASLKLVAAKRSRNQTPAIARRVKLGSKLHEQLQLAIHSKEGKTYAPTRLRTVVNRETGERQTVEVPKRIKEWWWINEAGKINIAIKYGSKELALGKGGKNCVEVATGDELITALEALLGACNNGELDEQLEAASTKLRSGFKK